MQREFLPLLAKSFSANTTCIEIGWFSVSGKRRGIPQYLRAGYSLAASSGGRGRRWENIARRRRAVFITYVT